MKNTKKIVFAAILLISSITVFSQFVIDGQFRTRTMLNHGFMQIPDQDKDAAFYTSQRTRLSLNFKDSFYETRISVQDVRVWGDDDLYLSSGLLGNTASISIFESWMKFNANTKLSIKVGRQIWKYDDERILAGRNWLNHGMSYDGITISQASDKHKLDMGLSYNNNKENVFGNDYRTIIDYESDLSGELVPLYDVSKLKTINYLYYSYKFSDKVYASVLSVLSGAQSIKSPEIIYAKATHGINIFSDSDLIKGKFSVFYQHGKSQVGKNVSSYMIAAAAGRDIVTEKISFNLGVDVFSGNDLTNSEIDYNITDNTFDLLYGARYKFYGFLNHFTLMDRHTKNGGLINPYLSLDFALSKKHELQLSYHHFRLLHDVRKPDGTFYEKQLGSELGLLHTYKISKQINIKTGFYFGMPDETWAAFKNVNIDNIGLTYHAYTMLSFSPRFFEYSK